MAAPDSTTPTSTSCARGPRARKFANLSEGAPSGGEEDYVVLRHEGGQPRHPAPDGPKRTADSISPLII